MKWVIGILLLAITYGITTGLGHLGYATRNSGWGVFLLIVLPLAPAGILFSIGAAWWIALGVGGICLGLMIAGRNGLIIGMGMTDV
jgi:ABC-type molybdate transport system permease subunit